MAEAKRKPSSKQVLDVHKPGKSVTSDIGRPVIMTHHQILRDPMVTSEATTPIPETPMQSRESSISPLTAPELPKAIQTTYGSVDEPAESKPAHADRSITKELSAPADESVDEASESAEPEKAADKPKEPLETHEAPTEDADAETVITEETTPAHVKGALPPSARKQRLVPSAETISDVHKAETDPATEVESTELLGEQSEVEKDTAADKAEAEIQKLILSKKYFLPINTVEKKRAERFIAIGILLSLILGLAWLDVALDAGIVHFNSIHPVTHFFSN